MMIEVHRFKVPRTVHIRFEPNEHYSLVVEATSEKEGDEFLVRFVRRDHSAI